MPRDRTPPAIEVILPAGRHGRLVETINAGHFRIEVCGVDWIGRLAGAGALDRVQTEAAQTLAVLFERSGVRPHLAGRYDGVLADHCAGAGDQLLEALTAAELAA